MNRNDKSEIIDTIHREITKLNLRYKYPFENDRKHGFDYYGFFISIPKKAWLLICWSDESQAYFNKPYWLELSSRAAKKWREGEINIFSCDDIEYEIIDHPNDCNRLVIPLKITHTNIKHMVKLIINASNEVLADY